MENLESLIEKFNCLDTKLIISGYPEKDKLGETNYGIAWYTKETIESIAKKYGTKFVVLCEIGYDNRPRIFANGKILVLRIFDQKHPVLFPRILKWLIKFNNVKDIFVHSEFCTNGGVKNFTLLIPFLVLIKLFRKNVTYFAHNVVTDLTNIAPHLNLDTTKITLELLNFGIKLHYRFLGLICDKFIVIDEEIGRRLAGFVDRKKIIYHPFWITPQGKVLPQIKAREELKVDRNTFLILYFGFITWYKGADWIIDQVTDLDSNGKDKNVTLILAGGEAHSLRDKKFYQQYYKAQLQKTSTIKNIKITGFVQEKDIKKYFSAADLIIFSYRGLIGASGALNHAIQYKKPFLLSDHMCNILEDTDFVEALHDNGLTKEDITFQLNKNSFYKSIQRAKNRDFLRKLEGVSRHINKRRSFTHLIAEYYKLVFSTNPSSYVFSFPNFK